MATSKKINWKSVRLVSGTVAVCALIAGFTIFYLVSVNNSYTRGMQDGYTRAAKTIQAK